MDLLVIASLVGAFALFITTHVALAFGLAFRPPRWRAAVALLALPMAPIWGFGEKMRVRSGLWLLSLVVYIIALLVARLGA